jgi:hypothetical protein
MHLQQTKKSNLLVFRGVFNRDLSPADHIYSTKKDAVVSDQQIYTEMPKRFVSTETWIKFSNLKCWWCDQMPAGVPKFIPVSIGKDHSGNIVCDVYGHFDEWNCAISYAEREFPPSQVADVLSAICLFESLFSGRRKLKIMGAPPKTLMKAYSGNAGLTPTQYRDQVLRLNTEYGLGCFKIEQYSV